jgi:hypothetical protein
MVLCTTGTGAMTGSGAMNGIGATTGCAAEPLKSNSAIKHMRTNTPSGTAMPTAIATA